MTCGISSFLRLPVRWFAGCAALLFIHAVSAQEIVMADAERLAALLKDTGYRPSAAELERHYFQPASPGLKRFASSKDVEAKSLGVAISNHRADYIKAIELCLPAIPRMEKRISQVVSETARYLDQSVLPDVYFLIAAGQSGGTADGGGVSVALEVLCWFAGAPEEAEQLLEMFVAHEVVHFYQLREMTGTGRDSLLRQALMEGLADHVAGTVLKRIGIAESARHQYGLRHEAELWQAFKLDMDGTDLGIWMYAPGAQGMPADMGYWIGKQIIDAYLARVTNPRRELPNLLRLDSPTRVLKDSAYGQSD